ncbi:MAG: glycoside hydrolase family 16 protein [Tannerella sp.]|jgi:beta-glucanase (GH16 family)|nr:glycoside hydrolase family 16 protein [Tannerella sp.]
MKTILFISILLTATCTENSTAETVKAHQSDSFVPAGYVPVWNDEFDGDNGRLPDADSWYYETGDHGWGNRERQNYVAGVSGTDSCAVVSGGTLKIIARKKGDQVISVRMNTKKSWKYGYFEARLKLPRGKGTWPAFWMLPRDFKSWPYDGEIDIMEEVGFRPNWASSAIHCKAYNHAAGTQKTGEQYLETADSDFHTYAVEWDENRIRGYVDGKMHFEFPNDRKGSKDSWPFDVPFYLKLNLAWGGNWGGAQGVDENALPAVYEIDYVRVYQKK